MKLQTLNRAGITKVGLIAALAAGSLMVSSITATASTSDGAYQYGASDKSSPARIPASWDIKEAQVGIFSDESISAFIITKSRVFNSPFAARASVNLYIDTDLDKKTDYTITATQPGEENSAFALWGEVLAPFTQKDGTYLPDGSSEQDQDPSVPLDMTGLCQVIIGSTSGKDGFYFNFPLRCIPLQSTMNIYLESTGDGVNIDRYPDGNKWWNVKTDFLKSEPCNQNLNGKKRTYKNKTYICGKFSGKWSWKDYGPIAASKSKYLTEKAYFLCNLNNISGASLQDGGRTLTLDGALKYSITESMFNCVTRALVTPSSSLRKIEITRALDGTVESSWGKIHAFWNYHPDNGLNITFSYN